MYIQVKNEELIVQSLFCDSRHVIYLAECTECELQYIGSTVNFHNRMAKYKRNITEKIGDTRLETHFRKYHADHENTLEIFRIFPIRAYDPKSHR